MKKILRFLLPVIVLSLLMAAAAEVVPKAITLNESTLTLDLNGENASFLLTAVFSPEDAACEVRWSVSDERIVKVEDGLVTPLKTGSAVVTARAKGYNDVKAACKVTVIDSSVPSRIVAYPAVIELEPSRTCKVECVTLPAGCRTDYEYRIANTSVATVDENGLVTAVNRGSTTLTVVSREHPNVSVTVPVSVEYGKRITDLYFAEPLITMQKDETVYSGLVRTPADSSKAIIYTSSDENVISVDEDGNLTAHRHGKVIITATSYRNFAISATLMVTVEDKLYPTEINYTADCDTALSVGESMHLSVSLLPETCDPRYEITSSREDIVSVDGDTLTGLKKGMSIVTVRSLYNPDLTAEITVTVSDGTIVLEMPLRKTDEAGIDDNVARIRAIKENAVRDLTALYEEGSIGQKEYKRRTEIVEEAFSMYDFVWTVDELQKYWSAPNSEMGAKDFRPGTFYYGLPYTSGTRYNHTYNVTKALEQERYVPAEGKNYYLLHKDPAVFGSSYAGNDCSAFVALAIWGHTKYSGEVVKTGTLYYDYRLIAFDDPAELKPGDILVRHSVHVVMFLYWADEEHTQAVFIQQGGSEPGINTVNTVVKDLAYYTENYYRLRRLRNWDD